MEKLISLKEAAKLLGYTTQQLRTWIYQGTLKSFKATPTSEHRIRVSDLEKLMESGSSLGENKKAGS